LAKEDEHGDDGGGFKIERHNSAKPKGGRKCRGGKQSYDAIDVGSAHTERNQREHV
jgi:hypothetical protein